MFAVQWADVSSTVALSAVQIRLSGQFGSRVQTSTDKTRLYPNQSYVALLFTLKSSAMQLSSTQ